MPTKCLFINDYPLEINVLYGEKDYFYIDIYNKDASVRASISLHNTDKYPNKYIANFDYIKNPNLSIIKTIDEVIQTIANMRNKSEILIPKFAESTSNVDKIFNELGYDTKSKSFNIKNPKCFHYSNFFDIIPQDEYEM